MYGDEPFCYEFCVPFSPDDEDGSISFCVHCGKELVKKDGKWYTWDADLHPRQKPQEP